MSLAELGAAKEKYFAYIKSMQKVISDIDFYLINERPLYKIGDVLKSRRMNGTSTSTRFLIDEITLIRNPIQGTMFRYSGRVCNKSGRVTRDIIRRRGAHYQPLKELYKDYTEDEH